MTNGDGNEQTGVKSIEELQKQTIQAAGRGELADWGSAGLLAYLVRAGILVSPWWSPQRDVDLRAFWKKSDHLSGAMNMVNSKITSVPVRVEPRDYSLKSHIRQADEYTTRLIEESGFGRGWIEELSKWLEDWHGQDNGAYFEIIGAGKKDGPIVGPALGIAHLDSGRVVRKADPQYPLSYLDETSKEYKLHYTRVAYASDMPSAIVSRRGVGYSAVSRAINVAQNLTDIGIYWQEKLGSRPLRGLLIGKGVKTNVIESALEISQESMDNAGFEIFAKIPIIGDLRTEASLDLLNLSQMPDDFDYEANTRLGMFAIALAFGVPIRWIWPAAVSGATKADAMYQHVAGLGGGVGKVLRVLTLMLGGDPRGPRHMGGKFLPPHLKLVFDFQDDEQDRMRAEIRGERAKVRAEEVAAGVITPRVAREQALADGDLNQAQFDQLELTDGRLPNGEDVLTLFYAGDDETRAMLNLSVPDPLDVRRNDAAKMVDAIEDKMSEVRQTLSEAASPRVKGVAKQAIAALNRLRDVYAKAGSAQAEAAEAEGEGQKPEEQQQEKGLLAKARGAITGAVQSFSLGREGGRREEEKGGPGSGHHGHAGRPGKVGGSLPGSRRGAATTKGEKIIRSQERSLAKILDHEEGFVFSPDGTVRLEKVGGESSIRFTPEEIPILKDGILSHNHPVSGSSFSKGDLKLAIVSDLAELRAVGNDPSGETYLYRLTRPPDGWGITWRRAINAHSAGDRFAGEKLWPKVKTHEMSPEQAEFEHNHIVMERLADFYGWDYSREKLR